VTVRATEAISITGLLLSNSSSLGRAGVLSVTAPTLTLADGGQIQLGTAGGGPRQDLVIEVGRLTLTGGARIVSITTGTQGATIIVRATEAISIAGRDQREGTFSNLPSGLFTVTLSSGAGGRVTVTAPTLTLGDGARISAVNANGPGGAISVEVGRLTLTGGARIDSSASTSINSRGGQGGTVMVTATEAVSIAGRDQGAVSINGQTQRGLPSGLFSDTSGGGGAGGRVSVTTPTLTLADGAEISAKTASRGAGGTVTVAAGRVMVTGTAQITTEATGTGPGGTVVVEAKDTVLLTQGGTISASSFGQGDAGQITITAGSLFRSRQGLVTAEARLANGGEIRLAAPLVALTDSVITTTVPGGRGGNITIGPGVQFLTLNDSQIRAQALREAGGNITLDTTLLATPISTVAASGTLTIGQLVLPESLISVLPSPAFAQALELSRNRCVTRLQEGQVSRFVIGGRDGVPLEPGSLLPSPLAWGEQPDPAPLTDVQVGGLERPNPGSLYLREAHAQARWPGVLDVECTKWMGQ